MSGLARQTAGCQREVSVLNQRHSCRARHTGGCLRAPPSSSRLAHTMGKHGRGGSMGGGTQRQGGPWVAQLLLAQV